MVLFSGVRTDFENFRWSRKWEGESGGEAGSMLQLQSYLIGRAAQETAVKPRLPQQEVEGHFRNDGSRRAWTTG